MAQNKLKQKVEALTRVVQKLIKEVQHNASLSQGTLTAFQLHIGEKQEKREYKQDDGGNWSVDTKAQHWQTKKGYDEAIKLYGNKPAWVKEPSLIYNPKTKSYDPIKVEKPKDVKPYKRISL